MTIEKSPSPSANNANPAQSANRSDSAKGKTGNDEGSGGFGAILSAVDNAPAPADAPADTSADASKAKAAVKGKPGAKADPSAIDPNTLLQQNPQIAAAQAQAAADAASAAAGLNPQAAGAAQTAGDPATLAQQAAALNAALAQQAALGQTGQTPSTVPGQLPGGVRAAGRGTPGAADSTVALDTTAGAAPTTAAHGLLQARAKSGKEALQADAGTQATQTSSQNNGQAAGSERADAAKFMASLEQAQSAQTNRVQESALAPLVAKSDKQQTSAPGQSAKSTDPTYSGTALGVSGPDFSQSAVPTAGVAPEMQVAEQVSYWVTHNVQNAELKLDGLGQDPVAVNISVQGNEAQISFRSDEQATRDMLQNSGAQLKDMLQREGLVLTGVSVGTSGSGDAQGRGQSSRQNVRQAQIAPLQVASQDSTPRLRNGVVSSAGRSVDLFV